MMEGQPYVAGNKIDMLTLLEKHKDGQGGITWECRCDCGNVVLRTAKSLYNKKHYKSCGCRTQGTRENRNTVKLRIAAEAIDKLRQEQKDQ
jgi:hypothetical protein